MWKIDSTLHMENKSPQFFEIEYQFDIYVLGSVFAPYLLFSVGKKNLSDISLSYSSENSDFIFG